MRDYYENSQRKLAGWPGINVPLKAQVQMTRMKARNLLRTLIQIGIQNMLIMKETEEVSD